MNDNDPQPIRIEIRGRTGVALFDAMACTCELLVDSTDPQYVMRLASIAATEAWRIERKFSRYRNDNIVHRINSAADQPVAVDAETARLLDYAQTCYRVSDGLFDVTSGILRRVWRFDGSDRLPASAEVESLLPYIGWNKVDWDSPHIRLPAGMEIDLGGIGKEYAVDRSVECLRHAGATASLVNYGGDLRTSAPRPNGQSWRVGVDTPAAPGTPQRVIDLFHGALATSGDSNRYLCKDGIRFGHLLDPRSGWPLAGAPRSVTVAADICIAAGMLSSLAMLHGTGAETFLDTQHARYWCDRN